MNAVPPRDYTGMPLIRFPDWATRLERFFIEHQLDTFHYGRWDCCLFACNAIQVMTGIDPVARFRGRYATRREALIAIRDETGRASVDSIVHHVTSELQMQAVAPLTAQRGDLALIERGRDVSLGIVSLNGIHLIVTSERRLWRIPRELAVEAWRV
jgi:hypothetical protein